MQDKASQSATRDESQPARGSGHLGPGDLPYVEFAGRLGHELNNLLSTIIGSLGLLREEWKSGAPSDVDPLIDDALSAGKECAELVDRLSAAAGKQLLEPRAVDLNGIAEHLAGLLEQTLPESITLALTLAPDLPEVSVDPDKLEAALVHIAVNAKEAMPDGGTLVISTELGDTGGVNIALRDQGRGIPESLRDKVRAPLFSTKTRGAGRGLGLSIANGFATQSGGDLSIESEVGSGTKVSIRLPART
jgi:signal transduction histidine kinase